MVDIIWAFLASLQITALILFIIGMAINIALIKQGKEANVKCGIWTFLILFSTFAMHFMH